MKKVSELTGADLDYWVAKAEGLELSNEWNCFCGPGIFVGRGDGDLQGFAPSTDWSDAGPIIEREFIWLSEQTDVGIHFWEASTATDDELCRHTALGPTPLIAAMRAYVASKYGEEVPEVAS